MSNLIFRLIFSWQIFLNEKDERKEAIYEELKRIFTKV